MTGDEDPEERKRRLANIRQKRYYQKNKEAITSGFQKKIDDYKASHEEIVVTIPEPQIYQEMPKAPKRRGRKPNTVYSIEYIKNIFTNATSVSTRKTYFA